MNETNHGTDEVLDLTVRASRYVIYHPDGKTTVISSSNGLDCDVQSGFLVIKLAGTTHSIYNPADWVSVNVAPR